MDYYRPMSDFTDFEDYADPFDDDEYWINQREADDYRDEWIEPDEPEDAFLDGFMEARISGEEG